MDIKMIYFSMTGNTYKVAEAMAQAFQDQGHSTRIIPMSSAAQQDATGCDLLGVGTFCLASRAPSPFREFLRGLPALDGKPSFVFATSAESPGRVLYDQTYLLRRKGADVVGGFRCRGQYNFAVPAAYGRYPGRPDEHDLALARGFANALAEHVAEGKPGSLPESKRDALRPGWSFYDLLGLAASDPVIRLMVPKLKMIAAHCDQCGLCVTACPASNISLAPGPVIHKQCIRCYRCLSVCPKDVYRIPAEFLASCGHLVLYNRFMGRWLGDLDRGERVCR
ncbi:MAG: hypothetical protein C4536_00575 [Actinobacteria bacterium]|jgi:ferredoxin/flavodoxin|nr:MAG: hypothetical protein C4536_00575 [Actinomycetota bacterium]